MISRPNSHLPELIGWHRAEPLTGDASLRRYSRLWTSDGRTGVLVEYPPTIRAQLQRDLEVLKWCRRRGLNVPDLLLDACDTGRAVLSDLGATDAAGVLAMTPEGSRRPLLELMLEPLLILARCATEELPRWNPPLDRERLRWELAGFELWYLRYFRGVPPQPGLSRWLDELAVEIGNHPRRVCHRDYHLNNLLVDGNGGVGVIDIQDILVGPDTYDVVSLVAERAATRLISDRDRGWVLETWAHRTRTEPGWLDRAALVRIQRGLKVLGTFARFTLEGRTEYRRWLTELAGDLAAPLAAVGAPPDVTAFLLD